MKKDLSIQIIRIISMFSIVACHLVKNHVIGQFLTFGIYTFLFISGYLYSDKKINNKFRWLFKQLKKILLPSYIFIFILIILNYLINNLFDVKYIYIHLFNLQYFFEGIMGGTHLWFLTVIVICYIFTLYKEKILKYIKKTFYLFSYILISCIAAYVNYKICNLMFMILVYFLGMYYRNIEKNKHYNINKTILIVISAIILKLLIRCYYDGTPFYDCIVYSVVHFMLAYAFFTTIKFIISNSKFKSNCIVDFFDGISYYIYIVHYMLIVGPVSLIGTTGIYLVDVILVIVISLIMGVILKFICTKIVKIFTKNKVIKC